MTKTKSLAVAMAALIVGAANQALPVRAADQEDHTIRPGIGLGIVKLGMNGNMDGSYALPSGIKVDYAVWREKVPKDSPTLRFFYDAVGKLIQINSDAPVPATIDGISCKSSLVEVKAKYKNLERFQYRCKTGHIDYYDDIQHGIAFEFTWADGGLPMHLYAIIVHLPGKQVLADSDEHALAIKAK
jgi:hypothetical protein